MSRRQRRWLGSLAAIVAVAASACGGSASGSGSSGAGSSTVTVTVTTQASSPASSAPTTSTAPASAAPSGLFPEQRAIYTCILKLHPTLIGAGGPKDATVQGVGGLVAAPDSAVVTPASKGWIHATWSGGASQGETQIWIFKTLGQTESLYSQWIQPGIAADQDPNHQSGESGNVAVDLNNVGAISGKITQCIGAQTVD